MDPADFCTGDVAELFGPRKSTSQSWEPYAAFIDAAFIETVELDLDRKFRSIFLAGPTITLLADDVTVLAAHSAPLPEAREWQRHGGGPTLVTSLAHARGFREPGRKGGPSSYGSPRAIRADRDVRL